LLKAQLDAMNKLTAPKGTQPLMHHLATCHHCPWSLIVGELGVAFSGILVPAAWQKVVS